MRSTPLASPGPLGELFWLLSHPTCASLSAAALGVSLLIIDAVQGRDGERLGGQFSVGVQGEGGVLMWGRRF